MQSGSEQPSLGWIMCGTPSYVYGVANLIGYSRLQFHKLAMLQWALGSQCNGLHTGLIMS